MNIKVCLFLLLFSLTGTTTLTGSTSNPLLTSQSVVSTAKEQSINEFPEYLSQQHHPQRRFSFSSPSGFFLLRQEEIIFIEVDTNKGGLNVYYRKHGEDRIKRSSLSLSKVTERFNTFPFIKVSRSTIINFNEIEEYEGTRRNARLVMSNGKKVNISRSKAGQLHDYIKNLEV